MRNGKIQPAASIRARCGRLKLFLHWAYDKINWTEHYCFSKMISRSYPTPEYTILNIVIYLPCAISTSLVYEYNNNCDDDNELHYNNISDRIHLEHPCGFHRRKTTGVFLACGEEFYPSIIIIAYHGDHALPRLTPVGLRFNRHSPKAKSHASRTLHGTVVIGFPKPTRSSPATRRRQVTLLNNYDNIVRENFWSAFRSLCRPSNVELWNTRNHVLIYTLT